ncbi:MAG TPA: glycosyltransferase family 87 protein [Phycisphaerae bacterium]|nr:glycosyltransferase family 87 protein [Phycisphaerae bacterium]
MSFLPRVRRSLFLAAGLFVVLIITLIAARQAENRVTRRLAAHSTSEANDFDRWMWMVPEFLDGRSDYVNDRFPTPPITIALFEPFTRVSPAHAEFVWACVKPLLASIIFFCCMKMAEGAGVRLTATAIALILAAWFWPVIGDVQEGQTNLLMLTPLALGLWIAQREDPESNWIAGLLIGLAVSIKVTPVIFLLYFGWRRRWRIVLAALCSIALCLVILPSAIFGPLQNTQWLIGWTRVMILPYVLQAQIVYATGESLPSMLTRFLRHVPAFGPGAPVFYANFVDLSADTVGWIIRGVLGVLAVVGLLWMRRPLLTLRCQRYVGEVGAVAIMMLWASERTWVAHYVTLLLPLTAVGMLASGRVRTAGIGRVATWSLWLAAGMMLLTSDLAKVLFGRNGRELALMVNVPLWASAGLAATIIAARLNDRPLVNWNTQNMEKPRLPLFQGLRRGEWRLRLGTEVL